MLKSLCLFFKCGVEVLVENLSLMRFNMLDDTMVDDDEVALLLERSCPNFYSL
jgi:hypothetical protein